MSVTKEVSAAELRQAMGKVARRLERTGEPILLKLGNRAVGVLVSVKDFEERGTKPRWRGCAASWTTPSS